MSGLLGALQFLTRLPVRTAVETPHSRVLPWFPVVGTLIGAVVGLVAVAMAEVTTPFVAGTTAVVAGLLLTGAFHEDGLADVADAFGGGWTVEERLAILQDSRHGTYGVAALVSSIAVRVGAVTSLAALDSSAPVLASVVSAHTLGRSAALVAARSAPPARDSGLGVRAGRAVRWPSAIAGIGAGLVVVAVGAGWWLGPFLLGAIVGTLATVVLAIRKIGGVAGDVLGAVEQVVECLVLVIAAGLATRHSLWWP